MPDGTTKYGDINQRTAAYATAKMLAYAKPTMVLQAFGESKPMPKNKADNMKFRRMIPFGAATIPLVEGVTPTAQKMQYEDVAVAMKQYGATIIITDVVSDLSEDPVMMNASELLGDQAGNTIEQLTYGVVRAGTSVFYANGAVRTAVNTPITLNKQRAVTRYLKAQKAMKISKVLAPSVNYATRAVEAAYIAVAHTDVESDIRNLAGFKTTAEYGTRTTISEHEIGSVEDVRYVLSADLSPFLNAGGVAGGTVLSNGGAQADVYPVIYFGKESFGLVPLKGSESITPMVVNMKPSSSDPLAQRGYVSFKTYFAAVILNQTWMTRLEVAVTSL
jgi:N4-gp56 family major capsid protein